MTNGLQAATVLEEPCEAPTAFKLQRAAKITVFAMSLGVFVLSLDDAN